MTFAFSRHIHSPPLGSYDEDPKGKICVPKDLKTVIFGIYDHDLSDSEGSESNFPDFFIVQIQMRGKNGQNLGTINPDVEPNRELKLDL